MRHQGLIRVVSIVATLIGLFLVMWTLPIAPAVTRLEAWVESLGLIGPVIFGAIYVLAAVVFVPGSVLTLAAGAIFGLFGGFVTVSIASTTAAGLSFLIARYVARDSVRQLASKSRKFSAADRAIGEGGWRIVAMLRLVPMFPFSVGNYLLGLTPIRFWPYLLASWIGMMPGTFVSIYVAHLGRAGVEAVAGTGGRSWLEWALMVVAFAAALGVTVYLTSLVRRKLAEQTELADAEPGDGDAPAEGRGDGKARPSATARIGLPTMALVALLVGACASLRPGWASGLLGPPGVVMAEAYADRADGATFDHSGLDALLRRHVDDRDGGGWVDHAGIAADGRDALSRYLAALAKADLAGLSRDELLTLLINAYNACTIELILERLDGGALASIRDIPAAERWGHVRWTIGGNLWSLDQIEHEQIRPKFTEPRIHWAVVCAAVGCPPLRAAAYTGAKLEAQLADQAWIVHTHPRWFRLDRAAGTVELTRLYEWYGDDFVQVDGAVLKHAARSSAALQQMIDESRTPRIRWCDDDWSLNGPGTKDASP